MIDEVDNLFNQHQQLRMRLPNVWNAFFAKFGRLRPVQLAAIPTILDNHNVLITAPTAGGKTEAIAAPLCEKIISNRWQGLSVMLVTPTRALVNDLYLRLEKTCQDLQIGLGRKTADHAMSATAKDQFLITTPESLESLLTFNRMQLNQLRAIVIDEIHLLDGTGRGDQLRILLQRLEVYLTSLKIPGFKGLQRIALSATVPNPQRLAGVYLGTHFEIVSVPGQRELESQIIVAQGSTDVRAQAAVCAFKGFSDLQKVLVFVNSRKQVDEGSQAFKYDLCEQFSVFGHHGNLSKQSREQTERQFREERRAICVATMTLEVGIDIGDIDLVVCMDPPFSLSSFLQRIGRGCRRLAGKTRVLCVARDRAGELIFESLIRQSTLGLPIGPVNPFRLSVAVQQILAYLRQVDNHVRTAEQIQRIALSNAFPEISKESLSIVLNDMVCQGLIYFHNGVYQPATLGRDIIESNRIYSNMAVTPPEYELIDADTGVSVAKVAGVAGKQVKIAGKGYNVVSNSGRKLKVLKSDQPSDSPKYHSRVLPYAPDLGLAIQGRLGLSSDILVAITQAGQVAVFTWLGKLYNNALASCLVSLGYNAVGKEFALLFTDLDPAMAFERIRAAVTHAIEYNPLRNMSVERTVDIGPYFGEFTDQTKEIARCDWLDAQYLESWISRCTSITPVDPASTLGNDLTALL